MNTAIQLLEQSPLREMQSDALGTYVRNELVGVATKLVHIKPYVEELWRRFEKGETILGCATKKQFCEQVLQRSPRAIRFMLAGGNPGNARRNLGEEIISPRTAHALRRIRAFGDFILAALIEELVRYDGAHDDADHSGVRWMDGAARIHGAVFRRLVWGDDWELGEGEPRRGWCEQFVPPGTPDACEPDCEFCIAFERAMLPQAKAAKAARRAA